MTEWSKVLVLKTNLCLYLAWVRISLYLNYFYLMLNFYLHLNELKLRAFYLFISFLLTFVNSYFFILELIYIIIKPFLLFVKIEESDFIFTNIFEVLNLYITLAFNISFFFSSFVLLYYSFSYLKTGFFKYEKYAFFCFLKGST